MSPLYMMNQLINVERVATNGPHACNQMSVLVSQLPEGVDEDYLVLFFEHNRFGKTEVRKVFLYVELSCAVVMFAKPERKF